MIEIFLFSTVRFWAENELNISLLKRIQDEGDFKSIRGVKYFVIVN